MCVCVCERDETFERKTTCDTTYTMTMPLLILILILILVAIAVPVLIFRFLLLLRRFGQRCCWLDFCRATTIILANVLCQACDNIGWLSLPRANHVSLGRRRRFRLLHNTRHHCHCRDSYAILYLIIGHWRIARQLWLRFFVLFGRLLQSFQNVFDRRSTRRLVGSTKPSIDKQQHY
jgi:hypothetical protein